MTTPSIASNPDASCFQRFLGEEGGWSLTELMVVIVIIGVLALIAIPKFMNVVTRAKMTEAKNMLSHVKTLQKSYYYQRDRYAGDLEALGFEQSKLVTDGGDARYRVQIEEAGPASYVVTATAVVDFDKDGTYNVWELTDEGTIRERQAD